jgi:hypothetical protein
MTCPQCHSELPDSAQFCPGRTRAARAEREQAAVRRRPDLQAAPARLVVEAAVGAGVAGDRLPQVVRARRVLGLLRLLRLVAGAGQVAVGESGGDAGPLEPEEARDPVLGEDDAAGAHVAVNHPRRVQRGERRGDGAADRRSAPQVARATT